MQTQTQTGVEVINQDGQLFVSGADGWREVVVATKADLADWGDYVSDLALQGLGMCMRVLVLCHRDSCVIECSMHEWQCKRLCTCPWQPLGAQGGGGDGTGGRGVRGRHRLHRFGLPKSVNGWCWLGS